jgi:hypothetical protein
MPTPNKLPKTDRFMELAKASAKAKEKNDCTVIAVAVVTGSSYEKALKAMTDAGRAPKHGASMMDVVDALCRLGFRWEQVEEQYFISDYPKPHARILQHVTTHHADRFPASWADGNTYIVETRKHVAAVVNGVPHDHTRNNKKHAVAVYRVFPANKAAASQEQI